MSLQKIRFVLVGPNEGKSGNWGGHRFTKGVMELHLQHGTTHSVPLARVMASYGAYEDGSAQHEGAVARWEALTGGTPDEDLPSIPVPTVLEAEQFGEEPKALEFTNIRLVEAIKSLDPADDSIWTNAGLPYIGRVEKAYGQSGLNRKAVNDALPGWDRDAAVKHRLPAQAASEEGQMPEEVKQPVEDIIAPSTDTTSAEADAGTNEGMNHG